MAFYVPYFFLQERGTIVEDAFKYINSIWIRQASEKGTLFTILL